jgi:hypothetical protein
MAQLHPRRTAFLLESLVRAGAAQPFPRDVNGLTARINSREVAVIPYGSDSHTPRAAEWINDHFTGIELCRTKTSDTETGFSAGYPLWTRGASIISEMPRSFSLRFPFQKRE